MPVFYDPVQRAHNPATELHNGSFVPYAEHIGRIDALTGAIVEAGYDLTAPQDFGMAPIATIHSPPYLDFLQNAHQRWRNAGRQGDASGYAWPVIGRRPLTLNRIDADLGQFSFDASTPIAEHSWRSAYANAQSAIAAVDTLLAGAAPASCGLCRPPGHHAGADYMGGYCYLNNVA
ncbi:MAG: histone deacetylase family protein, partial [Pseudomonadota bacterium]